MQKGKTLRKSDYDSVARDALITATARAAVKIAQDEGRRILRFEDDLLSAREAFVLGYRTACAKVAEVIASELAR